MIKCKPNNQTTKPKMEDITMGEKEDAKKYRELKAKEKRYWTKQKLMLKKASAAGITVTEAEIDAEIKK